MKRFPRSVHCLALSAAFAASGCASLVRPTVERFVPPPTTTDTGLERFVSDDFGLLDLRNEQAGTLPWKLIATALVLSEAKHLGLQADRGALSPILERFGLLVPEAVANWPRAAGPAPTSGETIGQTRRLARSRLGGLEIELRSPGCPLCHSGVMYDASGKPTRSVWLGIPNQSLQLDELNRAIPASLRAAMRDEAALLSTLRRIFPEASPSEIKTYERAVLPRVRARLRDTDRGSERLLPFDNGGAGTVNNVAARLVVAGAVPSAAFRSEQNAIVSIPILTNRAFRTSLMWDGAYVPPGAPRFEPVTRAQATKRGSAPHAGLLAVFSIGEGGIRPSRVPARLASFEDLARGLDRLAPPPFPGPVDRDLAADGERVFANLCSSCHGDYEMREGRPRLQSYPNRLVSLARIGTDPRRAQIVTSAVASTRANDRSRTAFRYAQIEPTFGYVAPILDGVWTTAPYLHNGSVPTLWHLMHPEARPTTFEVGGHRLDYDRMGIALEGDEGAGCQTHLRFPENWTPRSINSTYDTRLPGRSNAGHEFPFDGMTEGQKRAVTEYLKLF